MMTLTRKLILTAAVLSLTPTANGQFDSWSSRERADRYSKDDIRPMGDYERSELRRRYEHELRRLSDGYDYRAPLSSAVEDTFRRPYQPSDYSRRDFGYVNDRGRQDELFRYPTSDRDRPYSLGSYSSGRHRCPEPQNSRGLTDPFRPVDYSSGYRGVLPRDRQERNDWDTNRSRRPDYGRLNDSDFNYDVTDFGPADVNPRDDVPRIPSGSDPFTPALPRRDGGMEIEGIRKAVSSRYSNPVSVRAVQAMSANQGLALFREVSRQTDGRHLEPSSYDLRVRRGLRNIGVALEEPSFLRAMGMSTESFRLDGFRSGLARLEDTMRVSSQSDAERILQTVMTEAANVPGLSPAVVAYEFANGTVETLDRFSALEPKAPGRGAMLPSEGSETKKSAALESEIVGIGVEVKLHDDGLIILRTLRGGPAREAGLKSGDIITAINNRTIKGVPMANSVDMMTGPSGSQLQLQIVRNSSSRHNVNLTRRRVRIYTVNDARLMSGTEKVAYMNLTQFGQKSTEELDQALTQLHNSGMKSLILDLRGNPGGLLNVCVDITNRFVPCGTIVSTKGRLSTDNMVETATYSRTWSVPLVVLIDGDSASASEIFAAAVQDNKRGIVVGEKSYGKGTVQTHFPLSSISGNLRLTTARFYSPSGRAMSGSGVTPDVPVADSDGVANGDRVLREAVVIAQSQRLRDIAQASKRCRPSSNQPLRNSFKKDHYDAVDSKQVL